MTDTLTQHSFSIVRREKKLLIFPAISTVLVMATFIIGLTPLFKIEEAAWSNQGHVSEKTYVIFMTILLIMFAIIGLVRMLFDAGLTACALKYVQQQPYTTRLGFSVISRFFWKIFLIRTLYDGIAVYVKLMRYWVDDWSKSPSSMRLVSGLSWNDATLLMLPVLVNENTTFLQTLQRSAELVKNKWGDNATLRSNFFRSTLSFIGMLAFLPIIIGMIIGGNTAIIIGAIITVVLTTIKNIIYSGTQVVENCALYLYATDINTAHFFDTELLKKAFRSLTKKELHLS